MSHADIGKAFSTCVYQNVRIKQADAFTRFIDSRSSTKAYVVNLNGAWGTGKSFFVNNWCHRLKENSYASIKIDVWESDYLNDPLAILTSELLTELEKYDIVDFYESEKRIFNVGWKLAKNFFPVIMMAIGQHYFGKDFNEILKEVGVSTKDLVNDRSSPVSRMGDFGEHIFSTHKMHKEFVHDFKRELTDLISIVCEKSGKDRVYIFIDELDRCRPTYAIEMLEVVKHLFDIPRLVFVMSTDTKQLESSIKSLYGEQFDAEEYLSRFFQRRLTLSKPKYFDFVKSMDAFSLVNFDNCLIYPPMNKESAQSVFALFCEYNDVSLRRAEQLCARVDAALVNLPSNAAVFFIELVGSIFCYELYPKYNIKYNNIYEHGPHEQNGFKYDIKIIGDVNDVNPNTVLNFHRGVWDLILSFKNAYGNKHGFSSALEKEIFQNFTGGIERCYVHRRVGGLPYFVGHLPTSDVKAVDMLVELLSKINSDNTIILSGDDLEEFLHIFESIS
ncbi:KAP family NTPase [Shewanella sp. SM87]|uniref:KAP family P-loop NTPase fold protein n=1 Tax=Shewanella sp. SM87 TaxID=2912808 RepID=UPI0021D99F67|nr:KAP family NTPase [Shewanella sp. SM87]MCU8008491.1 KAP family NTPase [Shewanella sp. SM87]